MLCLLTTNPRKYAPFVDLLAHSGITLYVPDFDLPELQDEDFLAVVARKARLAHETTGRACLVDDSGLLLDAYPGFPGPLTGAVCQGMGAGGLERLLTGVSTRARMVCYIGCWVHGELWHWRGEIAGTLDPRRSLGDGPGPLSQWFVPDEAGENAVLGHRAKALAALVEDLDKLRHALGLPEKPEQAATPICAKPGVSHPACVFCQEFDGQATSIFHDLSGGEVPSRVIHQTDRFLVFPPLGQFVEGGLLLSTREHLISMAALPEDYYDELEQLMAETSDLLLKHYGCRPLLFEHAPLSAGDKGTCCVDHAHLNVFPVPVDVHQHLRKFSHTAVTRMCELANPRFRQQAYLFLQTNDGSRFVYEPGIVPSQYIRKIVTAAIGMPDRWHWREYLGLEELKRTMAMLAGWPARGRS